jgi:hypothetical protein
MYTGFPISVPTKAFGRRVAWLETVKSTLVDLPALPKHLQLNLSSL